MNNFIIKVSLLLISMIFAFTVSLQTIYAEKNTYSATFFIDGKEIYPSQIIINDSLLIPLRVCIETLGDKITGIKILKNF